MNTEKFLRAVWPKKGLFCVAIPGDKGYKHYVRESIIEAAMLAEQLKSQHNVFFCIHTLREKEVWNEAKQKHQKRVQWNMLESRAFFLDLDVGESTKTLQKYASQKEALADLQRFLFLTHLPQPMVVSSGGGLHVYWRLDAPIPSQEWKGHAMQLEVLCKALGLKADPARTTDEASILRVAGTFNLKNGGRRDVVVLHEGEVVSIDAFEKEIKHAAKRLKVDLLSKRALAAADDLGDNTLLPRDFGPPPSAKEVGAVCEQFRYYIANQDRADQTSWFYMLGLMSFMKNGRAVAHQFSKGHPSYTADETDAKLDQWADKGVPSCQTLADKCGPAGCVGCQFQGFVNPFAAARKQENNPPPRPPQIIDDGAVVIPIPPQPQPYKWGKNQEVVVEKETKEGKVYLQTIFPYALYPIDRSADREAEKAQHKWRCHLPHNEIVDFTLEGPILHDDKALKSRLADLDIHYESFADLRTYMSAYIRELQKQQPPSQQFTRLGWTDKRDGFVLADKMIGSDGMSKPAALASSAQVAKEFVGKDGDALTQIQLMHFFNHPGYTANQFVILAGLAAPIFYATGQGGVIINAAGGAGCAKSSTLFTAASLWGNPTRYVMNGTTRGSTDGRRIAMMDMLSNLPVCVDEITEIDPENMKALAFTSTQSQGRGRLSRDGVMKKGELDERSTMILTTSNVSLHHLLSVNNAAGTAGQVRVLEIMFRRRGIHKPFEAEEFLRGIKANYGHIGEAFARAITKHEVKARQRVEQVLKALQEEGRMQEDERFWFAAAAAVIVAAEISYKLGLLPFSADAMREFFLNQLLPELRGVVATEQDANSATSMLMNFLESINSGHMLKMQSYNGGTPNNIAEIRGDLIARYDMDKGLCTVRKDAFRDYCYKRKRYSQHLLKELYAAGPVVQIDVKKSLGAGTNYETGRTNCFVVNLNHPDIASLTLHSQEPSNTALLRPTIANGNLRVVKS